MAPTNTERKIRELLDQRKIQPSDKAWEAIHARINPPPAGRKRKAYRYAIAAVILGILTVSVVLVHNLANEIPQGVVVTQTPDTLSKSKDGADEKETFPENGAVMAIEAPAEEPIGTIESVASESRQQAGYEKQQVPVMKRNEIGSGEETIEIKVAEVLAQVTVMEQDNGEVTEAEIDALLLAAREEILNEQRAVQTDSSDALALLNEVEEELDASFREALFTKLKNGFIKVRTAVAARNE